MKLLTKEICLIQYIYSGREIPYHVPYYVNDLPSVPQCCKSKTYVDDNKLYITFPVQQRASVLEDMNKDLTKIRNWCFDNRLLLNASKTKLMLFGSRQMIAKIPNFNLSLLGKDLVPTRCARDLGVIFDDRLTFSDHTVKTVSSCMSSLAQINRAKHAFDKDLLVTIIKGLVFSKMFYCSSVWSNTSVTNINKLQAIQNFAARIVTRSRKFDHITPILKQLCWIPVKDHLFYRDALLTFKCMNGMAPTNLCSRFIKRGTISGRSTRNANILDIPRYKTATGQRSFLYRAVTIWNNLPSDIKLSSTMNIFKRKLINHLLMSGF